MSVLPFHKSRRQWAMVGIDTVFLLRRDGLCARHLVSTMQTYRWGSSAVFWGWCHPPSVISTTQTQVVWAVFWGWCHPPSVISTTQTQVVWAVFWGWCHPPSVISTYDADTGSVSCVLGLVPPAECNMNGAQYQQNTAGIVVLASHNIIDSEARILFALLPLCPRY